MAEDSENKKDIKLDLDFESIVPWNGQQDTGRDVRLKLDRNWRKVVDAFNYILRYNNFNALFTPHYDDPTDPEKITWIEAKSNFGVRGGVTSFINSDVCHLPSIYDGLPIDGITLYWVNVTDDEGNVTGRILKAQGGGGEGGGISEEQLESYLTVNQYAKKSDIPSLDGYATQDWVTSQKYASSSALVSLTNKVSDFLEGSDTDEIINKWKELETFLSGMSESDDLATILSTKWTKDDSKISNWDTAYGWGNHASAGYALKSYVDTTFVTIASKQDITGEKNFKGGLKVNGMPIVYDAANKYWKLEGDLLVTGGISMFSSDSAFVPSTIMDAINVDGTTISKEGGVLRVIGGTGGGVADSVAWVNITGKPDFASVATSGKYDDLIGKPTLLSSFTDDIVSGKYLPLSGGELKRNGTNVLVLNGISDDSAGVYLKMLHNDSKVGEFGCGWGLGTYILCGNYTLSIKNDGNGYINTDTIIHSSNYSNYALPLSGGTINGSLVITNVDWGTQLTINRHNSNGNSVIKYTNNKGLLGSIGVGGSGSASNAYQPVFNDKNNTEYRIYHSGNLTPTEILTQLKTVDGSGSGLDADLLDNLHSTDFVRSYSDVGANYTTGNWLGYTYASEAHGGKIAGGIISVGNSDYGFQLNGSYYLKRLYWRGLNGGTYTDWYQLAFINSDITGNAGSATKLQTPRTIWGQEFDGTGDVDGNLILGASYAVMQTDTNGNHRNILSSTGGILEIGKGTRGGGFDTILYGYNTRFNIGSNTEGMRITSTGNVGIGTTSPAYKLCVIGESLVTGANSIYGVRIAAGGNTIDAWQKGTEQANLYINNESTGNVYIATGGGNVGIGTTSSSYKLDVNGTIRFASKTLWGQSFDGTANVAGDIHIYTIGQNINDNSPTLYFRRPESETAVKPSVGIKAISDGGYGRARLSILQTNATDYKTEPTEVFSVKPNGNVGIGTTSPQSKLHVYSTDNTTISIQSDGSGGDQGAICMKKASGNGLVFAVENRDFIWQVGTSSITGDGTEIMRLTNSGNVGIGTNNPAYKLDVNGTVNITSKGSDAAILRLGTDRPWVFEQKDSGASAWLSLRSESDSKVFGVCASNGSIILKFVGVSNGSYLIAGGRFYPEIDGAYDLGTSGKQWRNTYIKKALIDGIPIYKSQDGVLYIDGNLALGGGVTMYSDIRKKTKLADVELTLKQVADAPLIEHYYNSDNNKTTHVGSIAQYWYGLNDWFCKNDSEGFLTMEIQNAALASAISVARELVRYESKTDRKIRLLKERVRELENEVETLKNMSYGCN